MIALLHCWAGKEHAVAVCVCVCVELLRTQTPHPIGNHFRPGTMRCRWELSFRKMQPNRQPHNATNAHPSMFCGGFAHCAKRIAEQVKPNRIDTLLGASYLLCVLEVCTRTIVATRNWCGSDRCECDEDGKLGAGERERGVTD